jgi:hypothetical protein
MEPARLERDAQRLALPKKVALADDLVQIGWTQALSQRCLRVVTVIAAALACAAALVAAVIAAVVE